MARGPSKPDIWSMVEDGLSIEEMHINSLFFMLAGSETTATLLSGLMYLLLRNPDKLNLLKEEIRNGFDSSEGISYEGLATMKYLNACINEGLRLYPPVTIGMPRVTPPEGNTVMGTYVPGNTVISVHQTSAYLSPLNFKDPHLFAPGRWMNDPEYASDNLQALQAFILGPRNCLGQV
jgi:cytochrome P450